MIIQRRKRKVPGLNATSTADISFILLVFFLVISSMDSNKGLTRQLPPPDKTKQVELAEMDKRNVLDLSISADGKFTADDKPVEAGKLRRRIIDFLKQMPDRKNHVVVLQMQEQTKYDAYYFAQDELQAAYNTMRDAYCRKRFRLPYDKCTEEQKNASIREFPQRVSEQLADAKSGQTADGKSGQTADGGAGQQKGGGE